MSLPTVTPAYGRDYRSLKAAQKDWNEEKDFVLNDYVRGGTYTSCRDFPAGAMVRYAKLTKIGRLKPAPAPTPAPALPPMTIGAAMEASREKTLVAVCNECGYGFRSIRATEKAMWNGCPRCNSGDIEIC